MKQGIHPDYQIANVHCSCGNTFTTRSTVSEIRAEIGWTKLPRRPRRRRISTAARPSSRA